jgi:hypothetical protein
LCERESWSVTPGDVRTLMLIERKAPKIMYGSANDELTPGGGGADKNLRSGA